MKHALLLRSAFLLMNVKIEGDFIKRAVRVVLKTVFKMGHAERDE